MLTCFCFCMVTPVHRTGAHRARSFGLCAPTHVYALRLQSKPISVSQQRLGETRFMHRSAALVHLGETVKQIFERVYMIRPPARVLGMIVGGCSDRDSLRAGSRSVRLTLKGCCRRRAVGGRACEMQIPLSCQAELLRREQRKIGNSGKLRNS